MGSMKKPVTRRPEFVAEAEEAKGKKYIVMSQRDKIDFASDDMMHAIGAFASLIVIEADKIGVSMTDGKVLVLPIPDHLGELITESGKGLIAFHDKGEDEFEDGDILGVAFGLSKDDWEKYGPPTVGRRSKTRRDPGKPEDYKFAYTVIDDSGNNILETDDREEAFVTFARVSTTATQKYGYGPGVPVAIQFHPVPEDALDAYPAVDRLKKKAILMASLVGHTILLAVMEGVSYEEWHPVAEDYLSRVLGEGNATKLPSDTRAQVAPPRNLKSPEEAIRELGARYVVMGHDNAPVVRTDDEYEAMLKFYEAQERYGEFLKGKYGPDARMEYQIVDGPTWSDTELPTVLASFRSGSADAKERRNVGIIGMSKRTHDLLLEPQAIDRNKKRTNSPWSASVH